MIGLIGFIKLLLFALEIAILIRVILSFLPMPEIHYHPVVKILYDITDPILEPLRRFTTIGMIDWSPVVVLIVIQVILGLL